MGKWFLELNFWIQGYRTVQCTVYKELIVQWGVSRLASFSFKNFGKGISIKRFGLRKQVLGSVLKDLVTIRAQDEDVHHHHDYHHYYHQDHHHHAQGTARMEMLDLEDDICRSHALSFHLVENLI